MGPQAKIAVLTFALHEIENGHQWPRDIARRAVRFVDDEVRVERPSSSQTIRAALDEAALVKAPERRAEEMKKRGRAI